MRKQEFDDKLLLTLPPIPIFIYKRARERPNTT